MTKTDVYNNYYSPSPEYGTSVSNEMLSELRSIHPTSAIISSLIVILVHYSKTSL